MADSGKIFSLADPAGGFYIFREDNTDVNRFHLVSHTNDSGTTIESLVVANVQEIICDYPIPKTQTVVFPPTAGMTALEKIQVRGWNELAVMTLNSAIYTSLKFLELNNCRVSTVSGNLSALTDLMLINCPLMEGITQANLAGLLRLTIINCPFQTLNSQSAVTTLFLEGCNVNTLPAGWAALKFMYLYPRAFGLSVNLQATSSLVQLITRRDVNLTANDATVVTLID